MNNKSTFKSDSSILTIAMPTFNRVDKAIKNLKILINQSVNKNVLLSVFDNNSINGDLLRLFCEENNIRYVKRSVNIGSVGNISRIFEEVDTKWLVIFSDDDTPHNNFIQGLLDEIDYLSDSVLSVKFKTELDLDLKDCVISNLDEFSKYNSNSKRYGSTLLLSSWLFNVSVIKESIRFMYIYAGLQCPHVLGVMHSLHLDKGILVYRNKQLISFNPPSPGEGWSSGLTYSLMLSTLPTLNFISKINIKLLAKGITGNKFKTIIKSLLWFKTYNNGLAFDQIGATFKKISIMHFILYYLMDYFLFLIPNRFIIIFLNADLDKKSIDRM
jgi:hypothetical protein